MPNKLLYHMIRDGTVVGAIERTLKRCEVCGTQCSAIIVTTVDLPEGIKLESTILWDKQRDIPRVFIGIGCGCYAKFHRQIAHIQDKQRRS